MKKKIRNVLLGFLGFLVIVAILTFTIIKVPEVPEKNDSIRVVSYNLKNAYSNLDTFEERKQLIVDQILSYKPDVIGVQEADYEWMTIYGGLPELLEDYEYVGVGRDDGSTSGEYAAIFYLKDKYTVIDSGTFWLSETPEEVSIGWDASTYRIVTWVTLEDNTTNEQFTHYNTHFDHIGKESQLESAELIVDVVSKSSVPFIITGDFNVLQGSDTYDIIVDNDNISDSKKVADDSMSHGTVNWFLPINVKWIPPIDFVFVSNDINVTVYRVDNTVWFNDVPVSDHYPVIVDFEIK